MKDIFTKEEIPTIKGTRKAILKNITEKLVPLNQEMGWLTTDKKSYGWEDINTNFSEFWNEFAKEEFNEIHVGFFKPEVGTIYEVYEVVEND